MRRRLICIVALSAVLENDGDTGTCGGERGQESTGCGGVATTSEPRGIKEAILTVSAPVEWLQARMGKGLGLNTDWELVLEDVIHELEISSRFRGLDDDKACIREPEDEQDADDDALRTAERLVYGGQVESVTRLVRTAAGGL